MTPRPDLSNDAIAIETGEHTFYDKRLMYEPSIRIPLMIRYPKRIKPGTVRDTAIAWADDLGKISPNAKARIKGLIAAAGAQQLPEHLVAERDSFVASLHHRDGLEGITAFLEKRAPNYR